MPFKDDILTSLIAEIYQPISPSSGSSGLAMKWSCCFPGNSSLAHAQVLLLGGRSCLLRRCPLPPFSQYKLLLITLPFLAGWWLEQKT